MHLNGSVSVVIATRDRAASLQATLNDLDRVAVPAGWSTELLIVDNGSSDATADVARRGRLGGQAAKVLVESQPGASRARNRGAAAATGDVVLFLDDDMRPPESWLVGLALPILGGAAAATVSQFRLGYRVGHERPWLTERDRAMLVSEHAINPAHPFFVAGSMGIRHDVFAHLGGFDEELGPGVLPPSHEDLLLTARLLAEGEQILFVNDVEVLHLPDERKLERHSLDARRIADARSEAWLAYHWFGRSDRHAASKAAVLTLLARLAPDRRRVSFAARAAWHAQMRREQQRERKYQPASPGRVTAAQ